MIGLLRWTFVVPVLARTYTDPLPVPPQKNPPLLSFKRFISMAVSFLVNTLDKPSLLSGCC